MSLAEEGVLRDHPKVDATAWVRRRRARLRARGAGDLTAAVSSGCAASGAGRHATQLVEDAHRAMVRLDAGLATRCEVCSGVLSLERLDAAPAAVRCTRCARPYEVDTRWCR